MPRGLIAVRIFILMFSLCSVILTSCGGGSGSSGLSAIVPSATTNNEKVEINAEGTGAIENNDIATAKESAI